MNGVYLRKYGVETTIDFQLYTPDGVDFKTDAAHASGDTKIMKDEAAEGNTTNGFVDEGQGYSITLTATEMQAARVVVYVVDQTSPKVWLDMALTIDTYGNASAQHAFDLDTANQISYAYITGVTSISGGSVAFQGATVANDTITTTTFYSTTLASTYTVNDQIIGCTVLFYSPIRPRCIVDYVAATGLITVYPPFDASDLPAVGAYFLLLPWGMSHGFNTNTATITAGAITAAAIATGAIDADAIADNAIDAGAIATGAITNAKFAAGAIDATAIANGAIDAATFAAGAIDATAIANAAIDAATFAAGAINAAAIADSAIDAATFAAGAITAAAIATGAIDADAIADNAIDAGAIATGAITNAKFAAGAIDAAAIADNAIDAGVIAADAITAAKIANAAIDAATFAAGAIDATAIAAGAIDAATLATDMDTYQAKVWLIDDNAAGTPTDRYVVAWYKNSQPITAGITTPLIQVIKATDGTDLIGSAAMTQVAATGLFRYDATTTARITDGAVYFALCTATIGGGARTWYQPIGRDSH